MLWGGWYLYQEDVYKFGDEISKMAAILSEFCVCWFLHFKVFWVILSKFFSRQKNLENIFRMFSTC